MISSRIARIEISGMIKGMEFVITLDIDVFQLEMNANAHQIQRILQCRLLVDLILKFMERRNLHFNRL